MSKDEVKQADVDLSAIMIREGIHQIRYYAVGCFSVQLHDGQRGVGGTVGEALARAKAA